MITERDMEHLLSRLKIWTRRTLEAVDPVRGRVDPFVITCVGSHTYRTDHGAQTALLRLPMITLVDVWLDQKRFD